MADRPARRPEGDLIARAMKRRNISARQLAPHADLSEARLRQVIAGYQSAGAGQRITVIAPAATLARIARALDIAGDQLAAVGRADAAAELAELADDTAPNLADIDDAAVAEIMRRRDISESDKRCLVQVLIEARRADEQRRLALAQQLIDVWRRNQAG